MTPMMISRPLICFCLLFMLPSPSATCESANSTCSLPAARESTCSSPGWSFEQLSTKLKSAEECMETLVSQWADNQTASILEILRGLIDILQKHKKTVCKAPIVHSKGGLVCVSVKAKRYCKPMCNEGFDFAFLRRSRLYEECGATTGYKWTTQYVGGNRLAVCNKSNIPIAGAKTAYFPKDQDCLSTKSDSDMEAKLIETFIGELKSDGISGPHTEPYLFC